MTYDDGLMATLAAVADAAAIDCWNDYEMVAVGKDFTTTPLPEHHLTDLIARGWLETNDVGTDLHLNVSSGGLYHLGKYRSQQKRKARARA